MTPHGPTAHVPSQDRIVFSHRGLNKQAPENTLPAFQLSADAGAHWLEMDVDILGDGTVVVLHDSTLDRTTDASGSMYELTADDLDGIDAGAKFQSPSGVDYTGTRIPTFAEFIKFLNENKMNANVEIKAHEAGAEGTDILVNQVIAGLEQLDPEREVIISSFSPLVLERVHQRAPQYAIGLLFTGKSIMRDWLSQLEMVGASYIHLEDANPFGEGGLTQELIQGARNAGYGVNVWTVNDKDRARELFEWGATGVFTDVADEMLDLEQD